MSEISRPSGCLLCGSSELEFRDSLEWPELRKAWELLEVRFRDEAWPAQEHPGPVSLWRCRNCRFEFFDPELAGNGAFYADLQGCAENYYPRDSFEFFRARDFAVSMKVPDVLDMGCGSGNFLSLMREAGLRTFGMELNPAGAEAARKAGHEVYDCLLSDLLAREGHPRFGMVTAWQVLEHVADPAGFFAECARMVRPGGYLAAAVPHEEGIQKACPLNPHQWPPHHVSRWRLRDLKRLGAREGLEWVSGGADPLYGVFGEYMWKLHNKIAPALGRKAHPGGELLPKLLWLAYRKTGARHFFPGYGPSIYAFYRKP